MDYREGLTQGDALAMIEILTELTGVVQPRLSTTGRNFRGSGFYKPEVKTIVVGRVTEPWILVHEFAHHMMHEAFGRIRVGRRDQPHGEGFYYKLRRVTALVGGEYPWDEEYKTIQKYARRDGLLLTAKTLSR